MPAAMALSRSWVACWQMSAAHELECPLTFLSSRTCTLACRHRVAGMAKGVKVQVREPTAFRALAQVWRNLDRRSLPPLGPMKTRPSLPGWANRSRCQRSSYAISLGNATRPSPGLRLGIVVNQPAVVGLGRQGGASGAAGPSSEPNSASRRPARRTQGHTLAC